MYALGLIASLLVVGLVVGFGTGTLLVFTGGRVGWDLVAGQLGALAAGGALYFAENAASRAPVTLLVAGLAGAVLATWLVRMLMWPSLPKMAPAYPQRPPRQGTVVMTHGDARQLWLSERKLVAVEPGS